MSPSYYFPPGNTQAGARQGPRAHITRKVCLVCAGSAVLAVVTTAHPSAWKGHLAREAEAGRVSETSRWYRLAEYIRGTSRRMITMRVLSAHTDPVDASAAEARAVIHYKPRFASGVVVRRELPDVPDEDPKLRQFREGLAETYPGVVFTPATIQAMHATSLARRQGETPPRG